MARFLLLLLLVSNVVLRVFTNLLNVLPKSLNIIDLPITWALFGVSLVISMGRGLPQWAAGIPARLVGFTGITIAGSALNSDYFDPTPAVSQYFMLVTPILVLLAILRVPFSTNDARSYLRVVKALIVLEILLGVLQLPARIKTGNSELVFGTFPGNAEQYATFLMIASFYFMAQAVLNPRYQGRYIALILLLQILNISIDNKASWLGAVASLSLLYWRLQNREIRLKSVIALLTVLSFIGICVGFIATRVSTTMYRFEELAQTIANHEVARLGKVKAYVDIARSHTRNLHMVFVGSGLATFYSRASRQFYLSSTAREKLYSNPLMIESSERAGGSSKDRSESMDGVISVSLAEPYFHQFYGGRDLIRAVGSHQIDTPYGPYAGLLGETGLLGVWLYLGIYAGALRLIHRHLPWHRSDRTGLPLLAIAYGTIIYVGVNSIYGPLLETTRLTTILWSFVGLSAICIQAAAAEAPGATQG